MTTKEKIPPTTPDAVLADLGDRTLRVVELRAENVMRLQAVTVRAEEGGMVVISGGNGEGKSSTLNSMEMAFRGGEAIPEMPVRKGAERAVTVLELSTPAEEPGGKPTPFLVIERVIKPNRQQQLVVRTAKGARVTGGVQALLDALYGPVAFDPLAFTRMGPREQFELLRDLVGLDTSELEAERDQVFASRTNVNAEVRSLSAQLSAAPALHEDAPKDVVSVEALMADLQAVEEARGAAGQLEAKHDRLGELVEAARTEYEAIAGARETAVLEFETRTLVRREAFEAEEGRLEAEFATHRETVAAEQTARRAAIEALEEENAAAKTAAEAAGAAVQDPQPLRDQIAAADGQNQKLRENRERAVLAADLTTKQTEASGLSASIVRLDEKKREMIASADFPVEGLALDAGKVFFNGVPFSQASASQKSTVSTAISIKQNPKLPLAIIRDASLLDDASYYAVAKQVNEAGADCWAERVQVDEKTSIVIEDGMVAGA